MTDQVLSSVTNFALTVAVARTLDADAFGAFGIAFALYRFVLGVGTGMWVVPVMVTHAGAPRDERTARVARAAGATFVTGVIALPLIAALALAMHGPMRGALLGVAVAMPGLALQDGWRQGFVAMGQPYKAAVNDLAWAGMQALAVLGLIALVEDPSVFAIVAAWGLPGSLAALLGGLQARTAPRVRGTVALARQHRRLGPRFAGEFVVSSGQGQISLFALAAVSGTAATAGFRGAQVVFGPQRVLSNGLQLAALPEAVRLRQRPASVRRLTGLLSGVNVVMVLAVGTLLVALPESWGRELLGETWSEARPLVLPMVLFGVAGAIASGPSVGLRAMGAAATCLRIQTTTSVTALAATIGGTLLAGASGAAWGLALATALGAALWVRDWSRHDGVPVDEVQRAGQTVATG